MKVPIQNIYYLLCYACADSVAASNLEFTGVGDGPNSLPNLLAFVLTRRLKPLVRRGLDRSYIQSEEETTIPRGRIDFGSTVARCSVRRQRLVCRRDELDANVLHNQILRTTAHILANHQRVEGPLRLELARVERLLHPIEIIRPEAEALRRVQLTRNNSGYRFLLQICELVWLNLLPDPSQPANRARFDAVRDDDRAMERILEEFIGNFYRLELPSFEVRTQQKLDWDAGEDSDFNYLPVMRADAVLRSKNSGRVLVIDAKYYRDVLVSYHERERIRSGHLYQMTAYLRSAPMKDVNADGLLLYPQSSLPIRANFDLSGRKVRVRTLDLAQPWPEVDRALRGLISEA